MGIKKMNKWPLYFTMALTLVSVINAADTNIISSFTPNPNPTDYNWSKINFSYIKTLEHPYMYFNSSDIIELRERWYGVENNNSHPQYEIKDAITGNANANIDYNMSRVGGDYYSYNGEMVGPNVESWAFAHVMNNSGNVTGGCDIYVNCSYLNIVKEAIRAYSVNHVYFDGTSNAHTLSDSKALISYATAYDLIYPNITQEERTEFAQIIAERILRFYSHYNYTPWHGTNGDAINILTARPQAMFAMSYASMAIANYTNAGKLSTCMKRSGWDGAVMEDVFPDCTSGGQVDQNPFPYDYINWTGFSAEQFWNYSMGSMFDIYPEIIDQNDDTVFWYYAFSRDGVGQAGGYDGWAWFSAGPLFAAIGNLFPDLNPVDNPTINSVMNHYTLVAETTETVDGTYYTGFLPPFNKQSMVGWRNRFNGFSLSYSAPIRNQLLYWWKRIFDEQTNAAFIDQTSAVYSFIKFDETLQDEFANAVEPTPIDSYAPDGGQLMMRKGYNKNDSYVWFVADAYQMTSNQEVYHSNTFNFLSRGEAIIYDHNRVNTNVEDGEGEFTTEWENWKGNWPDPEFSSDNYLWWFSTSANANQPLFNGVGERLRNDYGAPAYESSFDPRPNPAYFVDAILDDSIGFAKTNATYGDQITSDTFHALNERHMLFPDRDYLIIIDEITTNITMNITEQFHLGDTDRVFAEMGNFTLNSSNNYVELVTPRGTTTRGYFINSDDLEYDYINSSMSQYYVSTLNASHIHLRINTESNHTIFMQIFIPRFTDLETQPNVTNLNNADSYGASITDGDNINIVTYKNSSEANIDLIYTDADVSFTKYDNSSKLINYTMIYNGTNLTFNSNQIIETNESCSIILDYNDNTNITNITGEINKLPGDESKNINYSVYSSCNVTGVLVNDTALTYNYDSNIINFATALEGDIVFTRSGEITTTTTTTTTTTSTTTTTTESGGGGGGGGSVTTTTTTTTFDDSEEKDSNTLDQTVIAVVGITTLFVIFKKGKRLR